MSMTVLKKKDLVELVAQEQETTKKEAEAFVDETFKVFEAIIRDYGKGFKFGNLGTFDVVVVPERQHRKPSTGETFTKPEHNALKFKVNDNTKKHLASLEVEK